MGYSLAGKCKSTYLLSCRFHLPTSSFVGRLPLRLPSSPIVFTLLLRPSSLPSLPCPSYSPLRSLLPSSRSPPPVFALPPPIFALPPRPHPSLTFHCTSLLTPNSPFTV